MIGRYADKDTRLVFYARICYYLLVIFFNDTTVRILLYYRVSGEEKGVISWP